VLVAAAVIRVGYVATANVEVSTGYQFDMTFYREAGQRLAEGGGYTFHDVPTAAWPPGYPAFIAAAHLMSDAPIATVQGWQVALGTLTCLLAFVVAWQAFSFTHGLVAAAILALSPEVVSFTPLLLSETLFTAIFTGLLLLLGRWSAPDRDVGWMAWVGFGLLVGGATLVRGIALLLPLVPALVWLWSGVSVRATLGRAGLVVAGMLVALAPWATRNALVLGAPILVSTEVGEVLFIAHSPIATGGIGIPDAQRRFYEARAHVARQRELRVSADHLPLRDREVYENVEETRRAIRYFFTHPGRELRLAVSRIRFLYGSGRSAFTWGRRAGEGRGNFEALFPGIWDGAFWRAADLHFFVMLVAALVAVPTALVRSCPSRLLLPITIAWLTALHAIVLFGDPRFHFPLLPVFAVLASETLVRGWISVRDRCHARRTRPSTH